MKKYIFFTLFATIPFIAIAQNTEIQEKIRVIDLTNAQTPKAVLIVLNQKDFFLIAPSELEDIANYISQITAYQKGSKQYADYEAKIDSQKIKFNVVYEIKTKEQAKLPHKFSVKKEKNSFTPHNFSLIK